LYTVSVYYTTRRLDKKRKLEYISCFWWAGLGRPFFNPILALQAVTGQSIYILFPYFSHWSYSEQSNIR